MTSTFIDNYVINKKEFFQDLNSFSELNNWGFKTNENLKEKIIFLGSVF